MSAIKMPMLLTFPSLVICLGNEWNLLASRLMGWHLSHAQFYFILTCYMILFHFYVIAVVFAASSAIH